MNLFFWILVRRSNVALWFWLHSKDDITLRLSPVVSVMTPIELVIYDAWVNCSYSDKFNRYVEKLFIHGQFEA